MPLRFLTAGESHGPRLTAILDGMVSGLPLTPADLARDLARRQKGFGRGGRMTLERDRADVPGSGHFIVGTGLKGVGTTRDLAEQSRPGPKSGYLRLIPGRESGPRGRAAIPIPKSLSHPTYPNHPTLLTTMTTCH